MPRSLLSPEARFSRYVDRSGGLFACWPWTGAFNRPSETYRQKHGGGHSRRPVFKYGAGLAVYAHRFALSLADGVPLYDRVGLEACHRTPDPCVLGAACVNPAHLYWGTPAQNRADRYGN